ncbi:tryptophan-rich sensory protein [Candidatus Roizmanbacteria bacterium]|nr:tryptophan-rich sensory protein [Candidatus Roizmanbacteria bacterium]
MSNKWRLLGAILICQSAGIIGSFFTASAIPGWYASLEKPVFTPPNWLFAPVWLILYTVIGISLYRIWLKRRRLVHKTEDGAIISALYLFYIHLVINAYWSIVFFGMKDLLSAVLIIFILTAMVLVLIAQFFRIDRIAGILLIPYYLWLVYASCLTLSIWQLNRI